jgi:hypothetical protein
MANTNCTKTLKLSLVLFILGYCCLPLYSHTDCNVRMPELKGTYEGECRRGRAHGEGVAEGTDFYQGQFRRGWPHGEGTYEWAGGDVYTGEFRNGERSGEGTYEWATGEVYSGEWRRDMRHGDGEYTYFINGSDTTLEGRWVNDEFQEGRAERAWKEVHNRTVDRYRVINRGEGDMIMVRMRSFQGGEVYNLRIEGDSGHRITVSDMIGLSGVDFPTRVIIRYSAWNKLQTALMDASLELEFNEAAEWEISFIR